MYLLKLKITNFRKYGDPGLEVIFNQGLNVLIGENGSGKSTIIDAVRYILNTQSYEYIRVQETDFHCNQDGNRAEELKIECEFTGFTDQEAGNFLEWLGFDENNNFVLRVWLSAMIKTDRIIVTTRAGMDDTGTVFESSVRDLLRVTYLKPLRDAEIEMSSGRRSRFAQLLKSHSVFQKRPNESHTLEMIVEEADKKIQQYFGQQTGLTIGTNPIDPEGKIIIDEIEQALNSYTSEDIQNKPFVSLAGVELWAILQRLSLQIDKNIPSLGMMNLLYIAAEFLLLKREGYTGLKLVLLEELEAHLHPHYQLNVLQYLLDNYSSIGQTILTTHSVILGSSIPLENMIVCKGNRVYPMGHDYTMLDQIDYLFLERFLDATKANLFFAKGIIIVEGDAENLLLPAIADVIGYPLNKYGISLVKVGSKAWKRYAKIFQRNDGSGLGVRVAIIADGDVPCREYLTKHPPKVYTLEDNNDRYIGTDLVGFKRQTIKHSQSASITKDDKHPLTEDWIDDYLLFVSSLEEKPDHIGTDIRVTYNDWTLEYSLAKSCLKSLLHESMIEVHEMPGVSFDPPDLTDSPYEFMKPFLSNLSKALTAQVLAKKILDNASILKGAIEQDPELTYIIDAIKWACNK